MNEKLLLYPSVVFNLLLKGVNLGLMYEVGVRHELPGYKLPSLPYSLCVWLALIITHSNNDNNKEESNIPDRISNLIVNPLVIFLMVGLLYLALGGYRP